MTNGMPIKTTIHLVIDRVIPTATAFFYTLFITDVFVISFLKSLVVAIFVKVVLVVVSPEINKISKKIRSKLLALKRLKRIRKLKSKK